MTVVYLTSFCTVMRYVTISFELISRNKHITVYSTMHGISSKILWWKNFTKYIMVYSIKQVMNQLYYGLWSHIGFDVKRCYLESYE